MATTRAACLGALALCACHEAPRSTPAAAVARSTESGPSGPVTLSAFPARKPGLWQLTIRNEGRPNFASGGKICLDAAYDAAVSMSGQLIAQSLCPRDAMTQDPDGTVHIDASCPTPGGSKVSATTARGDFSSRYVVHTESETTGRPTRP
jgi:hypothetical protein